MDEDKAIINDANHQKYCCAIHGCHYNNDCCPVVYGFVDQQHTCLECETEDSKPK